jgi:hypothetical protein
MFIKYFSIFLKYLNIIYIDTTFILFGISSKLNIDRYSLNFFVTRILLYFELIYITIKLILKRFFGKETSKERRARLKKLFENGKRPEDKIKSKKTYLRSCLCKVNDMRKYVLKKYVYTINHKRIGLNYLYFSMMTGLSGAALATMIRLELAYPGSPFFKGDSLRYLQVVTAHGLIMVFFVVVPILFGAFANFLIPYHIGSKDVAFPRLNSIAFWLLPCGYILVSKTAFLRPMFYKSYDKVAFKVTLFSKNTKRSNLNYNDESLFHLKSLVKYIKKERDYLITQKFEKRSKNPQPDYEYDFISLIPIKLFNWQSLISYPQNFYRVGKKTISPFKRRKIHYSKCSERIYVTSG